VTTQHTGPKYFKPKTYSIAFGLLFAVGFSLLLYTFHQVNPGSHAQTPGYSIVGNKIIGPDGKQYAPYGFILECLAYKNVTSACQASKSNPYTDIDKIKATGGFWHGNTVRLQIAPENLLDKSPYDAAFLSKVDNEVNIANSLGLVVILSLQEEEYKGPPFTTQNSVNFWKVMADHYKSNPKVFFDLYNEPQLTKNDAGGENNMWNIWKSGGKASGLNNESFVGFQTIVNTIRGQGANNIIIAEANLYDTDLTQLTTHYLTGPNIAYGVEPNLTPHSRNQSAWYTNWGQYTKKVPIMPEALRDNVGNACDPNSPQDFPLLLNYLNSLHMGALYWTLRAGIVTTNANLTTPTTYKGHATITCPSGLSGLNPGNTVGPGADILAFFTAGTSNTAQPTPTITLTNPKAGSTVSGSVSVTASASVSSGSIARIVLRAGGASLKTCSNTPSCSASWDTASLSSGSYTLEADTTASDGNTNTTSETVKIANSHPVSVTPPTGVSSPSQTTSSIDLSWKAGTDTKYPASQLTYQVLRNGSKVGSTNAGVTSYTDSRLSAGTYYSYSLVTKDPAGNTSNASAAFTQNTKAPICSKPTPPQSLTGHAANPTTVSLSWKIVPNPSGSCVISHYVVARDTIPLSQPTGVSYSDSTAIPQTTYSYSVLAVETGNLAGPSSSVQVTTPPSTQPDPGPSLPTNIAATAVSDTQVNLTWNASTDAVTGIKQYNILRNNQVIGSSTTPSFGDSGLKASTQYGYQVIAVSGGGKTATSASINVTTLPAQSSGGDSSSGSGGNSIPPILQGTQSVGSGSDTGQQSSTNPTNPGSSTSSSLSTATPSNSPNHGLSSKKVAYVGSGTIGIVALAAAGYWFILRPRRMRFMASGSRYDPDLQASIVVGDSHGVQQTHNNNRERRE
jgi:hypothetical protein